MNKRSESESSTHLTAISITDWRIEWLLVTALFLLSRLVFYVAGVRMSFDGFPGDWQLLDLRQLRVNALSSIVHLHSQPPLFNLITALLVKVPKGWEYRFATGGALVLGFILFSSAYFLLRELEVPIATSIFVIVVLLASPALILYENWYFYTYATAAMLTLATLGLAKFLRNDLARWGFVYCFALAIVVLLNSTFQWPWMFVGLVPIAARYRSRWNLLLRVTILPVVFVASWYAKDLIMFHTYSTSSWLGMNMTHVTIDSAGKSTLETMVGNHQLSSIVLVPSFASIDGYVPRLIPSHPRGGARVLNSRTEDGSFTNFNNINFIAISNAYLRSDLSFIARHPVTYLSNVSKAIQVFAVPADEYMWVARNAAKIKDYASWYNKVVMLQPSYVDPYKYTVESGYTSGGTGVRTHWTYESFSEIVELLTMLLLVPYFLIRRRFHAHVSWILAFISFCTGYAFLATNLVELGENNRFQMDLGPLPLIATAAVGRFAYLRWHNTRMPEIH